MDMDFTYNDYIEGIMKKEILACKKVNQAVSRHIQDLENPNFYFDEEAAQEAISFISLLTHSKGKWAGERVVLEPWQQFIVASLFGWKRQDGSRRFRKAYIQVARKNGKTFLASALQLYDLITEVGAEVYSIATKRDQASISFNECKRMVKANKKLNENITVHKNAIMYGTGVLQALSSEDHKLDGFNPSFGLIDEYHAHSSDALVQILQSGMGSRFQPLLFIITTAGFDKESACHEEYDRCSKVLSGTFEDNSLFVMIFELDEEDDWTNEDVWIKANPNIDVSVSREFLQDQLNEAKQKASKETDFKTKNLDIWVSSKTKWLSDALWEKANLERYDERNLKGLSCFGAVDLSKSQDYTAFTACFPPQNGFSTYRFIHRFFIPQESLDQKVITDNLNIRKWIKQGYIIATPGFVVDYDFLEQYIIDFATEHDLREIAYDSWNASQFVGRMDDLGFTMVKFEQHIKSISPAIKDFERFLADGKVSQNNNPVINWMADCAELYSDPNNNVKLVKPNHSSSSKRIDGIITSVMSLARAATQKVKSKTSVYNKKKIPA